jgi:hypothetical protein
MLKTVLIAALTVTTGIAPADFPLQRLLKDPDAARTFDYWRLRGGQGPEAVPPLRAQAYAAMGLKNGELSARCHTDGEIEILAGLKGVESAASPRQWREDRDAAASAVRHFDSALSALMASGSSDDAALSTAPSAPSWPAPRPRRRHAVANWPAASRGTRPCAEASTTKR